MASRILGYLGAEKRWDYNEVVCAEAQLSDVSDTAANLTDPHQREILSASNTRFDATGDPHAAERSC
jgi:hypothetical protein